MKRNYTHITRLLSATLMLFLISALALMGQAPVTFNYQALLRDTEGNPRANASVSLELEIHQGTITGTIVYSETHNTSTNEFGIVNLAMGSVNPGSFEVIDWSAGPYFVEVSADGTSMGTSELLAVPYARHASFAQSVDMAVVDAATAGWDKNEADDFDGAFGSLSGIPAGLSDGDDNTQLNEGQVEAFINGDETSFNGWDKNAADDFSGNYGDLSGRPDLSDMISIASPVDGDIAYYRSGGWTRLPGGTDGEVLQMDGGLPDWRTYGSRPGIQSQFQFVTFHSSSPFPIAFGYINANGSVNSGSGNFTCTWNASSGRYQISITGYSYMYNQYTTVITGISIYPGVIFTTDSVGGQLLVFAKR